MVVGGLIPIAMSYLFRTILDQVVHITSTTGVITGALVGFLAFRYLLDALNDLQNAFLYQYTQRLTRYKIQDHLNYELSRKISSFDADHFENPKVQDLISKIRREGMGRIPSYTNSIFFSLNYGATLIGSFIALIPFGIWIPFLAIVIAYPRYRVQRTVSVLQWGYFSWNTPLGRRMNMVTNMLQSKLTVMEARLAGNREALLARLKKFQNEIFEGVGKPLRTYMKQIWIPVLLEALFMFIVIWLKLPSVVAGAITIGGLTFLIQMSDSVLTNTSNVNGQLASLLDDSLYVEDYFELMSLSPLIKEKEPGHEFEAIIPPKIEFEHVTFKYPEGKEVIKNVSLRVLPGEHVAIVGPNGAGKTTLIKLFLRFYDPNEGRILINGIDLKDIARAHWYKFVGTLFQDFGKYSLTVKENIAFYELEKPDEVRVRMAAKLSGADEFIEKFKDGYDQQLGREFKGEELSVGQWQKLALARAFYEQAPILVLDEPTSAIDAEAEADIFENLGKVYREKTVIFISHRFSTVRHADKIIVLKDGKIIEHGTHQALMAKSGVYARMFHKQAKGYVE